MKNISFWLVGQKIETIPFPADLDLIMVETPAHTDGPPPHYHNNYDEYFLVLEGEMEFLMGNETGILKKGEYAVIPRKTVHTFSNKSDATARWFNFHSPKGFGDYMQSLGIPADQENARQLSQSPESIKKLLETAASNDFNLIMNQNEISSNEVQSNK
ncbi:MAG: cupin domain-containing protein [Candidatus Cyclobacteriaceae bacterium M3_2C_046]